MITTLIGIFIGCVVGLFLLYPKTMAFMAKQKVKSLRPDNGTNYHSQIPCESKVDDIYISKCETDQVNKD